MAKPIFHVGGLDHTGKVVWRTRLPRGALRPCIAQMPPVVIGMEACGGAHDWARRCREPGPRVTLLAPQCVKASVKSTKHEMADADAMGEAVTRPTRRVVPIKALTPQDLHALQRVRARLVNARTARITEMRGWLRAEGIVLPHGVVTFRQGWRATLEQAQAKLTELSQDVFRPLDEEWRAWEERLAYDHGRLAALGHAHPACPPLPTIPGLGP